MFQSWRIKTFFGLWTALAINCATSSLRAQAPCVSAISAVYSGGMPSESATEIDPSSLLEEVDEPAKIINLTVVVPEKAVVKINGEPTFTKGVVRPYIVRGLKAGSKYKFKVEGLYKNETGAEYFASDEVTVAAGESKQVVLRLRRKNREPPPPGAPPAPAPGAAT